jgi:putative tRNA adenosine deaminase-associated protein
MPGGEAADLTPFLAGRACEVAMTDVSDGDVAVIVYREDETWDTEVLPTALTEDLSGLIHALRQQPSIGGTIGLVTVGDDFFVALRVIGGRVSVFLSDLTAAADWPLARQVLEYLDIAIPGDDDLDQVLPAGDMSIFADLGIDEMDLGALAGDLDQFPDEAIAKIATRLGFGHALDRALDVVFGP